jgi:hypothetical protein
MSGAEEKSKTCESVKRSWQAHVAFCGSDFATGTKCRQYIHNVYTAHTYLEYQGCNGRERPLK